MVYAHILPGLRDFSVKTAGQKPGSSRSRETARDGRMAKVGELASSVGGGWWRRHVMACCHYWVDFCKLMRNEASFPSLIPTARCAMKDWREATWIGPSVRRILKVRILSPVSSILYVCYPDGVELRVPARQIGVTDSWRCDIHASQAVRFQMLIDNWLSVSNWEQSR